MSVPEDLYAACTFERPSASCELVRITGELDACTAAQLEPELSARVKACSRHIVLDLADLQFIDSTGIRMLLSLMQGKRRSDLVLVRPRRGSARRALDMVGMTRVVRSVDGLDDALRASTATLMEEDE